MQKMSKFFFTLLVMLGFVGGVSWLIVYLFTVLLGLSGAILTYTIGLFITMPIILVITMAIGAKRYFKINAILYTLAAFWIPIFLHFFIIATILTMIYAFLPIQVNLRHITATLLAIEGILILYGIYIALNPKIVNYNIKSQRLFEKWGDKKIILFSDSHLGVVRHESFMKKIVSMINSENPDIVFIAGDLIDGPVFPYERGLAPLGELKTKMGVFYTAGNHDEYNVEQEKYYSALEKYVTVLNNKKTIINDTQIIGLTYAQEGKTETEIRLEKTLYTKDMPSIIMLHDPKNRESLVRRGVSLSLSGHTHDGQFFPFSLFVRLFYGKRTKGVQHINDTAHLTSVGVGTAGPLFRLGTKPEIAVIKIS